MSNGAECCAAGVCCPPASVESRGALVKVLVRDAQLTEGQATKVADAIRALFALAPKSLEPFIAEIVTMAHTHDKG